MKAYTYPAAWLALIAVSQTIAAGAPLAAKTHRLSATVLASTADAAAGPIVVNADDTVREVNVMGKGLPKFPAAPQVAVKRGIVRGYVRDSKGHPLKGAVIGVRSSEFGGYYSGASGKTDAHGYYEIKAPQGSGSFYCAGYVADYGDGIAAFGLHPEDGDTGSFVVTSGLVKNWVLLPYGVADRAGAQDSPHYAGNYYGGTIILGWHVDEDSANPNPSYVPIGSTIEITLTPTSPLIDGSRGREIVVRRPVVSEVHNSLYINNVPVAEYKISAKLEDGTVLRLKETGMYSSQAFGLSPKQATGEATLLLKAGGAKANLATAAHGNWTEFQVMVERP